MDTCINEGCNRKRQHLGRYYKDGSPKYRKTCTRCHGIKYGIKGWDYRQYRKNYCENIDGRLGFVCTSIIIDPEWQLDTDHINGDNKSHLTLGAAAMQTLCKNCHAIKTRDSKDYLRKVA